MALATSNLYHLQNPQHLCPSKQADNMTCEIFPVFLSNEAFSSFSQVGCKGHSSVEDAQTAMELYRLVEVQWERELAHSLPPRPPSPVTDPAADSSQYLDDQYWPTDLMTSSL